MEPRGRGETAWSLACDPMMAGTVAVMMKMAMEID